MLIPKRNALYDCFDGLIATICEGNNREYFMGFANKLYFRCVLGNNSSVEDCFSLYAIDYTKQVLERVHGVQFRNRVFIGMEQLVDQIEKENSLVTPFSLRVDIYDCPWSILYRKAHVEHEILVLSSSGNILTCLDPYITDSLLEYEIPNNQRFFECKKYFFLPCQESMEICMHMMKSSLNINKETIDENYRNLGIIIGDVRAEDVDQDHLDNFFLNRRLTAFENNRGCYALMLENLEQKYSICLNDEIQLLLQEKEMIGQLRTILLKSIIKGNLETKKIRLQDVLVNVYTEEKKLIESLIRKISNTCIAI